MIVLDTTQHGFPKLKMLPYLGLRLLSMLSMLSAIYDLSD